MLSQYDRLLRLRERVGLCCEDIFRNMPRAPMGWLACYSEGTEPETDRLEPPSKDHAMHDRFSVCRMTEDGRLAILFSADTYEECDDVVDSFSDRFPNGYVDIYKRDVLGNCVCC